MKCFSGLTLNSYHRWLHSVIWMKWSTYWFSSFSFFQKKEKPVKVLTTSTCTELWNFLKSAAVITKTPVSHQISVQSLYNQVLNDIRICSNIAQLDLFPFSACIRQFILLGWNCWWGFFACVATFDYYEIATWWSVQVSIKHQY